MAAAASERVWLPRSVSTFAGDIDFAWDVVFWLSVFFFVLITLITVYFMFRYKRRTPDQEALPAPDHHLPIEIAWSVLPLGIVVVLFWQGFAQYVNMATPPQDTYEIQVSAMKWSWLFTYPNGAVTNELHVPIDTPIELVMTSSDVLHAFFVPEFRVKKDIVPGRYSNLWFEATEAGDYDLMCTEYCGKDHSAMLAKVTVHEPGGFEPWLKEESDYYNKGWSMEEIGEKLYNTRGCKTCHSVDGVNGTGPTFLGLYGIEHALVGGGTAVVDENYVRESILEPQATIVAGYDPVMPTYQGRLSEQDISALIAYLKSLGN
ncbi:hypothetical protein ABI59_11815 [Acidobacteria bacterium Mor1]|nr:hypothetical protein ABI59_11815 [Acidobacteria bacterium Mor1]